MSRIAWFMLLLAAVSSRSDSGPSPVFEMPQPPGPFAVGRVSYDWVDSSRPEVLSKVPKTPREIMVDVWYPAAQPPPGAHAAPYLPDAEKIDKSSGANSERYWWRNIWPMVVSGGIHTHVYENVPPAAGDKSFPLIVFSHGYGVEPVGYTYQIEDLVSRGYVVATIHHTYEVAITVFPDGRMIPFSVENSRGQDAPTREAYRVWEKARVDVWAADISFTLDQIARLNAAPEQKAPFAGRIDIHRIGVFGHSFGGMAAARACSLDQRIMACVNQNGVGFDGSIPHYGEGHMPAHPYLYFSEMYGPGSDTTSKDGREQQAHMEKELRDCPDGAYDVRIGTAGFEHMSFADFALLQANGDPDETARALKSLQTVETYTAAFFDKFLRRAQGTLLDRDSAKDSEVVIKRYSR